MLSALVPSRAWCEAQSQHYRPTTAWARAILLRVPRWRPDRLLVTVKDGEFAALTLLDAVSPHMIATTRLRLDARLFDPPPAPPLTLRQVMKGARQPSLRARLTDKATVWRRAVQPSRTRWRSSGWIDYASGTALWHHQGKPIVPILWVMVRYPDGRRDPETFSVHRPVGAATYGAGMVQPPLGDGDDVRREPGTRQDRLAGSESRHAAVERERLGGSGEQPPESSRKSSAVPPSG